MADKESAQDVIDGYRKSQQRARKAPLYLIIAAVLLIIGAAVIIFWLMSDDIPAISSLFASKTPTPTVTLTPTPVPPSATVTLTPTEAPPTATQEPSLTPTLSGPVIYIAQEGDSLYTISQKFEVDILVLIVLNRERLSLDPANPIIRVGDEVLVPAPGTELPTLTPLPPGLPRGYQIEYMVVPGDSLELIAQRYNSTVEDILEINEELEDPNAIFVGQILIIRINLVTPVPTVEETAPPASTPGSIVTLTPEPTSTP